MQQNVREERWEGWKAHHSREKGWPSCTLGEFWFWHAKFCLWNCTPKALEFMQFVQFFLYFHVLFQFSRSVVFPRCARYLLNVFQAQVRLIVAEIYSSQRLITLMISPTQCEILNRLEKKKYCNNSVLLLEHSGLYHLCLWSKWDQR